MNYTNNDNTFFIPIEHEHQTLLEENKQLREKISALEFQVEQMKKILFATKTSSPSAPENTNQLYLFESSVQLPPEEEAEVEKKAQTEPEIEGTVEEKKKAQQAKRKTVSSTIEEKVVILEAPSEKKVDTKTGEALSLLGYETSERLHRVPSKLQRVIYKREKYGYKDSREVVYTAEPLKAIIPKGKLTDEFIEEILYQKYFMGVPLYRQLQSYNAEGADLSKSTLSDAVKQFAHFYRPIARAILEEVFSEEILHADETRINCQKRVGKKHELKETYFWAYRSAKGCVFHHGSRSHKEVHALFEKLGWLKEENTPKGKREVIQWSGYLMTDDYEAYETALYGSTVIHMACMAHVQRKFKELAKSWPAARELAIEISKLYELERQWKTEAEEQALSEDTFYGERGKKRQSLSKPILEGVLRKVEEEINTGKYPPQSAMRKALNYAYNLKARLTVFLNRGDLPIDNNNVERRMKGAVIGRKNYLFIGSEDAGEWAAICYSAVESCRLLGLEVKEYLKRAVTGLLEGKEAKSLTPYALREEVRSIPKSL